MNSRSTASTSPISIPPPAVYCLNPPRPTSPPPPATASTHADLDPHVLRLPRHGRPRWQHARTRDGPVHGAARSGLGVAESSHRPFSHHGAPNARVKPTLACEWDGWEVKPRTEVEPEGSVTGVAQFIMAWRWRWRKEGAGLTLLAEEEEGCT